jgi:hypothetical protein
MTPLLTKVENMTNVNDKGKVSENTIIASFSPLLVCLLHLL